MSDRSGYVITPVMRHVPILEPAAMPNGIRPNGPAALVGSGPARPDLRWEDVGRGLAVDRWVTSKRSPHTREAYRRDCRRWFDWCDLYGVDMPHARRWDVDAYRDEMADAAPRPAIATVRRRLAAVSSFYKYWIAEDVLPRNPAEHVARPDALKEPGSIALTLPQVQQLQGYADSLPDIRPGLTVRLLSETAMRVSELCNAAVPDLGVSSGHRTLTIVRKGGVQATTVLLPATAHALETYLQGRTSGPLLVTSGARTGTPGPLDRSYVRRLVRRLAREAGLAAEVCERMHPHVFRHSAATIWDEAGVPMQRIQRQLGHADIRQTERYAGHRQELEASPVYAWLRLLAA